MRDRFYILGCDSLLCGKNIQCSENTLINEIAFEYHI